ncbi:hypothetical protein [Actinoplanes sp. NPDC049265]|uniref:hypothetical protein n=1 Tax=Actinoplanes sp. NPDC049265 TaxID=3363902 RepID=UPI003717502F
MQLIDDRGVPIDAEYTAEVDGGHLAIVLESMSGKSAARAARNTDYRPALELLLARLRDLGAVVEAAVVDSLATQRRQIPEADRALLPGPVRLADEPDLPALRRHLTNAQMTIGQASDARRPGNSTKRIRLRLAVPGYGVDDAERLAADLATGFASQPDHAVQDQQAGEALLAALGIPAEIVDAEKTHVTSTSYERTSGTVVVRRAEAALLARYRQSIAGSGDHRLLSAVGHTDLYIIETGEIIEAKRGAVHRYVRDALGQLLDYAVNVTAPVGRLTALFPAEPSNADIGLLHTYGVDCLYWDGDSTFPRRPAPDEAREAMRPLWAATLRK